MLTALELLGKRPPPACREAPCSLFLPVMKCAVLLPPLLCSGIKGWVFSRGADAELCEHVLCARHGLGLPRSCQ